MCKVWLKLAKRFGRRRWKCEKTKIYTQYRHWILQNYVFVGLTPNPSLSFQFASDLEYVIIIYFLYMTLIAVLIWLPFDPKVPVPWVGSKTTANATSSARLWPILQQLKYMKFQISNFLILMVKSSVINRKPYIFRLCAATWVVSLLNLYQRMTTLSWENTSIESVWTPCIVYYGIS